MTRFLSNKYFIIILLEGCSVLAVELLGGKMISSTFGSSLFVWTSVIGVTLCGLTIGYYIGGKISMSQNSENLLFYFLLLSSLLIALMPLIGQPIMYFSLKKGVISGSILTALIVLGMPLIFLGTITPIIISLSSKEINMAGRVSGFIYAITTIGGIITTFIVGFFIVPKWGITYPLLIFSLIIGYYAIYLFYHKTRVVLISIFIFTLFIEAMFIIQKKNKQYVGKFVKLYEQEGLLGQLIVADDDKARYPSRRLFINNVPQTNIDKTYSLNSLWNYPHIISSIASISPSREQAAVFGIGGGSVAKELTELGFPVDAVDIDKRVFELSRKYFFYDPAKTNFIVDDARHYIRVCKKKYDVIVIDLLNGEVQPSHVFSIESFLEIKNLLNPDGILIIEFQSNARGNAAHSIVKTLQHAGFFVNLTVNGLEYDEASDVIFSASLYPINLNTIDRTKINPCCFNGAEAFLSRPTRNELADTSHAIVMTDDQPILEFLNKSSILNYRKEMSVSGSLIHDEFNSGEMIYK